MSGLSETIARLMAAKRGKSAFSGTGRLSDLVGFGDNPGALDARVHLPANLPPGAPLVVVLHGCTQTASDYDTGAGWSTLADANGFALLFPEQTRANNPNLCFNWFEPDDIARGSGEAGSIRQMVAHMVAAHGLDPARAYVTGLSAGGAMAAVMLAAYPDVFAGGAVIAGLPYGTATSVGQALERMRRAEPGGASLAARVRAASHYAGPWPTLSIWHGTADRTVSDSNAAALLDQWRRLHALPETQTRTETVDGHPRRTWCDAEGRTVIESYAIAGLGHGTPLDSAKLGRSGPHMLEAGISSTLRIAEFWGLTAAVKAAPANDAAPRAEAGQTAAVPALRARPIPLVGKILPKADPARAAPGVQEIIEKALRSAGLMK